MAVRAPADVARRSYNHPCLIARALDILGDRWTLIILRDLMTGLQHFNDILDNSDGLSPNVLSARLKLLEKEGLVDRQYFRELPPRVEYRLTEKGWSVRPVLCALMEWSAEIFGPVEAEQIGEELSTDFVVRTLAVFSFVPDRALDLQGTVRIEVDDCDQCGSWLLRIENGQLWPERGSGTADAVVRTDREGFLKFIRGAANVDECGQVEGDFDFAARVQACFAAV